MTLPRGHLSKSQLSLFLKCGKAYEFRYIKDISIPPAFAMVKGDAFDAGVQAAMKERITGRTPPKEEIHEVMSAKVQERIQEIDPAEPDVIAEGGAERAVGKFVDSFPKILDATMPWVSRYEPKDIQLQEEAEVGGYPFVGIMDLISKRDTVTDTKLWRSRKQPQDAENSNELRLYQILRKKNGHKVQGAEYVGAYPLTSSYKLQELPQSSSEEADKRMEETVNVAGRMIEAGNFIPVNIDSQMAWQCQRKFCGFFDRCDFAAGKKR